jgi:peptidoglycan/xylan/chitin deacetylase (PgdA/CDA1 family)
MIQAILSFDVDAEAPILVEGRRHSENAGVMSHQAYGPLVGVPRILDLLQEYKLPATFFVPGVTAERYPDAVAQILAAGHEIGHHSYAHFSPIDQDEAAERSDFERALEALARFDVEPKGFRCPSWEPQWRTPALVAEFGLEYDSSLMDADSPYLLETRAGNIVELPVHWALDSTSGSRSSTRCGATAASSSSPAIRSCRAGRTGSRFCAP